MIQPILDALLMSNRYRTVQDLQYIPGEDVIYVQRKMGFKSCLVDISGDKDEEAVKKHLSNVPAIY